MGWKRRGSERPVELLFHFDSPKNLSRIDFFVSNRFDLGIRVNSNGECTYSFKVC